TIKQELDSVQNAMQALHAANPLKKALEEQEEALKQKLYQAKPKHKQVEELNAVIARDARRQQEATVAAKQAVDEYNRLKLIVEKHKQELKELEALEALVLLDAPEPSFRIGAPLASDSQGEGATDPAVAVGIDAGRIGKGKLSSASTSGAAAARRRTTDKAYVETPQVGHKGSLLGESRRRISDDDEFGDISTLTGGAPNDLEPIPVYDGRVERVCRGGAAEYQFVGRTDVLVASKAGLDQGGRMAVLSDLFANSGFNVIGVQESWLPGAQLLDTDAYAICTTPATNMHGLGVQLRVPHRLRHAVSAVMPLGPRLLKARMRMKGNDSDDKTSLGIVVAHAPHEMAALEEADTSWEELETAITSFPKGVQ
ncbi:unnamed protein product, partial [Prorocentrum cordatum]